MPRNHIPGASTLRNRNRITNKTRLKIIRDNVDGDDLLIPDEDEEKHRLTNLVAGVDAEDANEHHLQEVLSAAHRVQATKKAAVAEDKPSVYIPTPDSTGLADDWEQLYSHNVWKDPATFVCTSTSVEESVRDGLANGFSYFMDERDKEWLDKNNEEARGEGTSAAGAISSASGTRTSARSAKAKGKEPDLSQPVVITEDEFELVMGLFEKVTHEKTEFLHHSLETGMPFPAFSEYQDTFATPLSPAIFATFTVPTWIPQPQQLLRIARTVYPYWKERRIERAGHRIIPTLNFDESDTLNESYICFRRREIKAVRKTRQAQVTSSDKLVRLQQEFAYPLELARQVLKRETLKREQAVQAQHVWERRMALVDLKRKFPAFADKADEDLLVDKERPAKRPEPARLGVKIPPNTTNLMPMRPEPVIKPRERIAQVREKTDAYLAKKKEEDKIWEDVVDNPQQTPYAPYASKLFKFIPPPSAPTFPSDASDKTADSDDERSNLQRAIRIRFARNNRVVLDRREFGPPRKIIKLPRSSLFGGGDDAMESDEDPEEAERRKRLEERWQFDADDAPSPPTAEEDSRILVDDYDPKYLRQRMSLYTDRDHIDLQTDATLYLPTSDGRQHHITPFRLGLPPGPRPVMRPPQQMMVGQPGMPQVMQGGIPVSMPLQLKKMPPPTTIPQPQMRISSNGGMRPAGMPTPPTPSGSQQPPPQPVPLPPTQHAPINGANGGGRAAIAMPHVDMVKPAEPTALQNGSVVATPPVPASDAAPATTTTSTPTPQEAPTAVPVPPRPKSTTTTTTTNAQQQQAQQLLPMIANGYPVGQMSQILAAGGFPPKEINKYILHQMQQQGRAAAAAAGYPAGFMPAVPGMNGAAAAAGLQQLAAGNVAALSALKMQQQQQAQQQAQQQQQQQQQQAGVAQVRPMHAQWSLNVPGGLGQAGVQRPGSVVNGGGGDSNVVNGAAGQGHMVVPVRSPSTNGMRPGMRIPSSNGAATGAGGQQQQQQMMQGGIVPNIAGSGASPGRGMVVGAMQGGMGMGASPPMQHQQPVGNQNGY